MVRSDSVKPPRIVRIPLWIARVTLPLFVIALAAGAYAAVTYLKLRSKAVLADELLKKNEELARDNERIRNLERNLATNRLLLQKMMELAGVQLDSNLAMSDGLTRAPSKGDSEYSAEMTDWRSSEDAGAYDSADDFTPSGIPMHGSLSRGFAPDESEGIRRHLGIDIAAREGTPVRATAAGTIELAGWDEIFGNYLIIDHTGGYKTHYGHNRALLVSVGDRVRRGELVALSGNTGRSSAPHLHYEIRYDGKPVDPADYLDVESLKQVN